MPPRLSRPWPPCRRQGGCARRSPGGGRADRPGPCRGPPRPPPQRRASGGCQCDPGRYGPRGRRSAWLLHSGNPPGSGG
eukprot:13633831-Alexandrium_andersonii.AAC.1